VQALLALTAKDDTAINAFDNALIFTAILS